MKYIYGPLNSRRLGLSLGVSLVPYKICNFDCIYCQLGSTKHLAAEPKAYLAPQEVIAEFKLWLENNSQEAEKLDYITISGAGEPTLNSAIAEVISQIKKLAAKPIAVITNASLLGNPQIRVQLLEADLVVPSLDTVLPRVFQEINRPHQAIKIEEIIEGLVNFRKEFRGKIWLEVMLVSGANDDIRQIKKLKEIIQRINPDKIQLNSPVRATAEKNILPVNKAKLEKIKEILGDNAEII
ncbi:MAG: radical SAM protein [Candidatus Omnitrophota bacterium]